MKRVVGFLIGAVASAGVVYGLRRLLNDQYAPAPPTPPTRQPEAPASPSASGSSKPNVRIHRSGERPSERPPASYQPGGSADSSSGPIETSPNTVEEVIEPTETTPTPTIEPVEEIPELTEETIDESSEETSEEASPAPEIEPASLPEVVAPEGAESVISAMTAPETAPEIQEIPEVETAPEISQSSNEVNTDGNKEDDFNIILDIGAVFNKKLHQAGIHTFSELGKLSAQEISEKTGIPVERIERNKWREQATNLAAQG